MTRKRAGVCIGLTFDHNYLGILHVVGNYYKCELRFL